MHGGAGEVRQQRVRTAFDGEPAGPLVEGHIVHIARRQLPAHAQQLPVQLAQTLRLALARQLGALEGGGVLRVGHLFPGERGERRELAPAPLARGVGDLRVDVVREELERRPLAVFLALEEHRREG